MQTITIAAIAVATAAGVIGTILFFGPLFATAEHENVQKDIVTDSATSFNNSGYRQVNVTINNVTLVASVAETNDQRTKGLSVKNAMNETEGMLFVFTTEREHSFWMKGMKFPIDIVWISKSHEVVHIEHSLEPCEPDSFCPTYKPDQESLYVLETVAGFAQKYNITENTYVDFELEEEKEQE